VNCSCGARKAIPPAAVGEEEAAAAGGAGERECARRSLAAKSRSMVSSSSPATAIGEWAAGVYL